MPTSPSPKSKQPQAAAGVDFTRLKRGRHASSQVYDLLREAIIDLSLPPGCALSRNELAMRFGVSSTPLRDALMRLEEDGLVDVFPQHATFVSRIDLDRVHQAHFLRLAIELEVVATIARAPDAATIAHLRGLMARQGAMQKLGDTDGFSAADHAFHFAMYEAAKVPELWTLVRSQSGHLDRLRRLHLPSPGKVDSIMVDHAAILEAVAAGDGKAAQVAMRRHLAGTVSNAEEIRKAHPDYMRP
jgi:GntR family transcriptional regulator, rspAB operon transcriptional repressor